ncbi:Uncharacterised protein [BD1-7 clade bacterium]|uniref:Phospholipid/glycerol acyltransferase domain-containing protein n=1 Tax=BD1-7 clade bacterium TaxID=2029982 RepID=A0A5S9N2M2_9GAMM|nr:Uncharacterised protein [BD1-7 clade bacterium]
MDKFFDIRPYSDDEVIDVINRIINDDEFVSAITRLRFPVAASFLKPILAPFIRMAVRKQVKGVNSVRTFQMKVEKYFLHMLETTTTDFTVSGFENVATAGPCSFISNHRDIVLDPAVVNYALHINNLDTVRIAIGDNLLTKDFATDLMRINKSFIVKRSAKGPRELFGALKHLSAYINHSIKEDQHSIWIAQREGRAKDGLDKTDPAILKMLTLDNRKIPFAEAVDSLNIVPCSVSYEYDPCDQMKARELHSIATTGSYTKEEHEDVHSIASGITGQKGRIHLSFGEPLTGTFEDADEVAAYLDKQIIGLYALHPTNYFAYAMLHGKEAEGVYGSHGEIYSPADLQSERNAFEKYIGDVPEALRDYVLASYANPIISKMKFGFL